MLVVLGFAFLADWVRINNIRFSKYNKPLGWILISLGLPDYILAILNLIERFQ